MRGLAPSGALCCPLVVDACSASKGRFRARERERIGQQPASALLPRQHKPAGKVQEGTVTTRTTEQGTETGVRLHWRERVC